MGWGILKHFGPFEFHVFKAEMGWTYNWCLRFGRKFVIHIAFWRRGEDIL